MSMRLTRSSLHPHRHQWIFITDTVDAVYRPDDVLPEAIFDQLAEIAGRLPVAQVRLHIGFTLS